MTVCCPYLSHRTEYLYFTFYSDTEFVDFDVNGCAAFGVTSIDGKCTTGCGGWTYKFEGKVYKI